MMYKIAKTIKKGTAIKPSGMPMRINRTFTALLPLLACKRYGTTIGQKMTISNGNNRMNISCNIACFMQWPQEF